MAKGEPRMVQPSDYSSMVEQQARLNRPGVTATGMGSLAYGPEGMSFDLDPSLTDTGRLEQAMYDKQMRLMRPEYERQESTMMQSLANRGLPSGGEAYGEEVGQFQRSRDEAMQAAANRAVMGGESARSQRLAQSLGFLGYRPTPVDVTGPAQIAQSGLNTQAQAEANAKGGATDLLSTVGMVAAAPMTGGASLMGMGR